jgi:hypothetical protein
MKNLAKAALIAVSALATQAGAVTIIPGACVSVTDPAGCKYNGNLGNQGDADAAELQYNAIRSPIIDLGVLLTKSDAANFGSFGSITGGGTSSGTWNLPGYTINFLGVKAGPDFILYQLASPASSGSWSTAGLTNPRGQMQDLSHLAFFGSANVVPEPAAWALLLTGFGLAGSAMRRRRTTVVYA